MIAIISISLVFLVLIVMSDIKTRQIPIVFLLGESAASLCLGYNQLGASIFKTIVTNILILGFQIFILWVWIRTKERNAGNGLWSKFGKGDLVMLAIVAINFSAMNYLVFILIACLGSIIIWVGLSLIQKFKDQTIPFAGFLAGGLMILRILLLTGTKVNYYSDHSITNLIYGIY